jgi:hypothetical protein
MPGIVMQAQLWVAYIYVPAGHFIASVPFSLPCCTIWDLTVVRETEIL